MHWPPRGRTVPWWQRRRRTCRRGRCRRGGQRRGGRAGRFRASCVTTMIVIPSSRLSCPNRSITSRLVCESRLPVGSSARRIGGSLARARAMATRCCCPPESCDGWWSPRDSSPTFASKDFTRRRRWAPRRPAGVEHRQFHVFRGRGAGQQVETLEDEADLAVPQAGPLVARHLHDLFAVQPVAAAGGVIEAAQRIHERGLPRARRAHQGHELAVIDIQRNALQGMDFDLAQGVYVLQISRREISCMSRLQQANGQISPHSTTPGWTKVPVCLAIARRPVTVPRVSGFRG